MFDHIYHQLGETKTEILGRGCTKISKGRFQCPDGGIVTPVAPVAPPRKAVPPGIVAPPGRDVITSPAPKPAPVTTGGPAPTEGVEPAESDSGGLGSFFEGIPSMYLWIGGAIVVFLLLKKR